MRGSGSGGESEAGLVFGAEGVFECGVLQLRPIALLDLPALAPYLTLRQRGDHLRDRLFVAEGMKVVERLLSSDLELVSALLTPDHVEPLRAGFEARAERIEAFVAEKSVLEHMTGFSLYEGLLVCARIPAPLELDVLCALAPRPRFLVAVDGLANAENLGGVIRNAAAFGAQGLIVGETCAHPYLRRSVRTSMGNLFRMPVVEPVTLAGALQELRRLGVRCIGAHPHAEARVLSEARLSGDCCIVLGSESQGLSESVREACDELVSVPMQGGVDSLNVGAASALFFHEVWRRRPGR